MSNPNVALTTDNKTALRAGRFDVRGRLYVAEETVIATARINNPSGYTSGEEVNSISVDNTSAGWSNVKTGMTILIGTSPGARDVHVGRVRKVPTSNTLYIGAFSAGDPGLVTVSTTILPADNHYITIIHGRNMWSVFPKLDYDGSTATITKDTDIAWDNQTSTKKPGILRIGNHVGGEADAITGVLTDSRTADFEAFSGETISAYQWTTPGTVTSGSLTSASFTATYAPGHHIITCTVTLNNGQTVTAERNIWVSDDDNPAFAVKVTRIRKKNSTSLSLQLLSDFEPRLKNNPMCLFVLESSWSGSDIASSINQVVGWIDNLSGISNPVAGEVRFDLISGLDVLGKVIAFSQLVEYSAAPANWQETNLPHIEHILFYLLYWHTTLLRLFDLNLAGLSDYETNVWLVNRGNFITQISQVLRRVNAELTQLPNGTLQIVRDLLMVGTDERNAATERITLIKTDIAAARVNLETRNQTGRVEGNAFLAGTGDKVAIQANSGNIDGQGGTVASLNDQLTLTQEELNLRTALQKAKDNNPLPEISLDLVSGGYMVIEPALRYWVPVQIPAELAPFGEEINARTVPKELIISFDDKGIAKATYIGVGETDANATPGVTVIVPDRRIELDPLTGLPLLDWNSSMGYGRGIPSYIGMSKFPAAPVDDAVLSNLGNNALAWNSKLTFTSEINKIAPNWTLIAGISGNVLSVIRLSSTRALVLTTSNVYDVSTITGTPTVTNRQALTDGKLLRYAEGVTGGIASGMYLATTSGGSTSNYTNGFTSGLGTAALTDGTYPFGKWANGAGLWSASGGRSDAGCVITTATGVSGKDEVTVYVDLGSEVTITAASMYHKAAASSKSWGWRIAGWNASKTLVSDLVNTFNAFSNTSYIGRSWSGSLSGVRYLSFTTDCNTADMDVYIDDIAITYTTATGGSVTVKYSDDAWVAVDSTQTVGDAVTGEYGYDVDDFDLGIHLAAADGAIFSSTSYTGTFAQITGLSVPSGAVKVRGVRAILKVVASQADNDTASAFQFIYGTDSAISGKTLFLVTFARDTRVAATETNITPIIDGVTYVLVNGDGNQIESYGGNTRRILGFFQPVGGGDTVLLGSVDGGTTWAIKATFEGQWVRFVEPGLGGNGLRAYVGGGGGIRYTENFGSTLRLADGDFGTETLSDAAVGVFKL